jgi:hypothetical protein
MNRTRVARPQTQNSASPAESEASVVTSESEIAHIRQQPADHAHRWRVRAGALSLFAVAVGIPLAAGAAAQPLVKGRLATPATRVAVQTSALAKRIPKPKVVHHAKAKPAVPVTTAAPKPVVTAPPPTAPPTTQYVAPPTTRPYIPPPTTKPYIPPTRAIVQVQGSGRCGGNLPPCYVMMRESKGIITARNPSSTASGKWQFLDSTWKGYGGYASAADAPESVQDAYAAQIWAGGAGCSNWSAC